MTFSSLVFLFIFLPVTLLLYFIVPQKGKNILLVILSFIFYAWGSPKHLLLLVLSLLFNYFAGLELEKKVLEGQKRQALTSLVIAVAADLFVLGFFKYSSQALPVGISFYTFSVLSYLFDIYRGNEEAAANPLDLALFISFFPKLTSGPIVQYREFKKQIYERVISRKGFFEGMQLFLLGLFKKVLLADNLGAAFANVYAQPQMAGGTAWLGMIFYSLQLYFDFSGYSDMAIGLAKVFGFEFKKNFDYPYLSKSVPEFWRRWHISLGAWFRDYVYIPLGGNRCSTGLQVRNLMVVWILTGIWHGSTLNYVFWGLYHGFFVLLDRFVLRDRWKKVPEIVQILVTDLIACFGWIFFFNPTLGSSFGYIGKMFGADGCGAWNAATSFALKQNLLLLIAAVLICGPFLKSVHDGYVFRRGGAWKYVSIALHAALLLLCIANMVSSTYSTFLYAAF